MNKIYIITGASSDVGMRYLRQLNDRLVKNDEQISVIAHFASSAENLKKLSLSNINMEYVQADLSNTDGIKFFLDECKRLCNNQVPYALIHFPAPKFEYTKLKNLEWDNVERELNISVRSFVEMCKEYLPSMAKNKAGKVVAMLTSYVEDVPPKFMSKYVLSKYALLGFVKSMASDYAGKGVSITGISPDMMETKFLTNLDPRIIELTRESKEAKTLVDVDVVAKKIDEIIVTAGEDFNGQNIVIMD